MKDTRWQEAVEIFYLSLAAFACFHAIACPSQTLPATRPNALTCLDPSGASRGFWRLEPQPLGVCDKVYP